MVALGSLATGVTVAMIESPYAIGLIVLIVVLLFGASRLPQLGRSMGESIRGFKKGLEEDSEEDKAKKLANKDDNPPQS